MSDQVYRWRPNDHRGSNSAFNWQPPPREDIPRLRQETLDRGGCGSWHPTNPYQFCNRTLRMHQDRLEHFYGWATWDGDYNDTRAAVPDA